MTTEMNLPESNYNAGLISFLRGLLWQMKEIILPVVETAEIGAVISTENFRFKSSLKLQKKKQLQGKGSLLLS